MDTASTLATMLAGPPPDLDEIAETIEEIADDPTAPGYITDGLDELCADYIDSTESVHADSLFNYLFRTRGFTPNRDDYYAPTNSFVGAVLRTKTGLPISLSLVAIEVGRRAGIVLSPVGMPGHFLIGDGPEPSRWFDPFANGASFDEAGCERIYQTLNSAPFVAAYLKPVPNAHVAARMLANLRIAFTTEGNVNRLIAALECVVALPIARNEDRHQYATMLASLGRCDQAAEVHDSLAALDPAAAELHLERAALLRNRRN